MVIVMNYSKIREKFKNGDWVLGLGEHKGCSPVFDIDSHAPQPFSYLGTDDADQFRIATKDEIREAIEPNNISGKPDGFYLLKSKHSDERGSPVYSPQAFLCPQLCYDLINQTHGGKK